MVCHDRDLTGLPGDAGCHFSDRAEEVELVCAAVRDLLADETPPRPQLARPRPAERSAPEAPRAPMVDPVDVFVFA